MIRYITASRPAAPGISLRIISTRVAVAFTKVAPLGVLALGFGLGPVFLAEPSKRDRTLLALGTGMVLTFFILRNFGSVPMFAYIVHIYLVHSVAILLHLAWHQDITYQFNFISRVFLTPQVAAGTGLPLAVVYVTWIGVVAALYPLRCWYARIKKQRTDWWLSYI